MYRYRKQKCPVIRHMWRAESNAYFEFLSILLEYNIGNDPYFEFTKTTLIAFARFEMVYVFPNLELLKTLMFLCWIT